MNKHLRELDSLRGLMALWVFLGHVLLICGRDLPDFVNGARAVDVFILLSGFVIARLLMEKREGYVIFLSRRALRLYPAYLIALTIGIFTCANYGYVFARLPWVANSVAQPFIDRHGSETSHFAQHLIAHLTLLHGAIPNQVLAQSALAFVGPAWSISLEWQFYLVAPLLVLLLINPARQALLMAAVLAFALLAPVAISGRLQFDVTSFLPVKLTWFLIGMMSWRAYGWLKEAGPDGRMLALAATLAISAAGGLKVAAPIWVWTVVLFSSLPSAPVFLRPIRLALNHPSVLWMGRISYGFYVYHMPVVITVAALLIAHGVHNRLPLGLAVFSISLLVVLFVSTASWKLVEEPAIAFGKRLGRRRASVPAPAE